MRHLHQDGRDDMIPGRLSPILQATILACSTMLAGGEAVAREHDPGKPSPPRLEAWDIDNEGPVTRRPGGHFGGPFGVPFDFRPGPTPGALPPALARWRTVVPLELVLPIRTLPGHRPPRR